MALRARPGRYLRSPWPWRSLAWCVQAGAAAGVLYGLGAAVVLPPLTGSWSWGTAGGLALSAVLVLLLLAGAAAVGAWQRHAARFVGYRAVVAPYPARTAAGRGRGVARGLARDLAVGVLTLPLTAAAGALALLAWWIGPLCAVVLAVTAVRRDATDPHPVWLVLGSLAALGVSIAVPWAWGGLALLTVRVCRRLTDPRGDAARRQAVERQAASVRLADAFAADRRRIERDLHDGAQQRIVAQGLTLGRAAAALAAVEPGDGGHTGAGVSSARDLVAQAVLENRAILADLRALVRSISPRVLVDRGLDAAVAEVATRAGVPVEVAVDLPGRAPALVEQTAYFVVLEALSNATKHAGATRVRIDVGRRDDALVLAVADDGLGGARVLPDGGLAGLIDRVRGIGGTVDLSSPPGGGTTVAAELPLDLPRAARSELARWPA